MGVWGTLMQTKGFLHKRRNYRHLSQLSAAADDDDNVYEDDDDVDDDDGDDDDDHDDHDDDEDNLEETVEPKVDDVNGLRTNLN